MIFFLIFFPVKKTPPVFGKGLRDLVVNPQTHVLINCTATGYPKPTVEWKHSEVNHIVRNRGLLTIQNILKTGTYTCVAKNVAGSKSFSVKVTVRPVPLAPVQVVEKAKTGSSLTISWQEGSSNKTIDSHIVKYRGKGTLQWTSVPNIDGQLTVWTIKDLDAYTNYEIQVFSKNSHGTSKGSEIVTVTTDETGQFYCPCPVADTHKRR